MELNGKVIIVTGGGSGIGAALCERFAVEAPRSLTIVDLSETSARRVATRITDANPGLAVHPVGLDVTNEGELAGLITATIERDGQVDLFVGNAGIGTGAGVDADDQVWRRIIDVNLMAHVYAARALLPDWLERGEGRFLITASAAGLLSNLGDAPYSVTKHGAVALAEWLSITYGDRGVTVSCLCPQGVRTPLLFPELAEGNGTPPLLPDDQLALEVVKAQRLLEPSDVADSVMEALADGRFLILPHAEVADYEQARANDRERWLRSMRRLQAKLDQASAGS
ncbi:MAG TPA: SDR family oxidoreductase [Microthrixaceae bacterium]|nr:SDR family oxidoreductase [Microthrixaceae bacterium]